MGVDILRKPVFVEGPELVVVVDGFSEYGMTARGLRCRDAIRLLD